jgi:hypothetical protein
MDNFEAYIIKHYFAYTVPDIRLDYNENLMAIYKGYCRAGTPESGDHIIVKVTYNENLLPVKVQSAINKSWDGRVSHFS